MLTKDVVSFNDNSLSKELETIFKDLINFSDSKTPISNCTPKSIRAKVENDRLELFVDSYLNPLNRQRRNLFTIRTTPKNELRTPEKELRTNHKFLLPYNNGKYSNNTISKVLEIHANIGVYETVKGNWDVNDSSKNIATNVTKPNITKLNPEFISYLNDNYSKNEVTAKLAMLSMLHTELGFYEFFKRKDWNSLEQLDNNLYQELQNKITKKEYNNSEDVKSFAKIYTGKRETKDVDKKKSCNYTHLEEESAEVKAINKLLPKSIRKYFEYTRNYNAYTDVDSCKKLHGTEEIIEKNGGRFSSFFNYGLTKDIRNWFMKSIGYVEVDMTAMLANTIYLYETGKFIDERIYNKVARTILTDKKRKITGEDNLEFATTILASHIKRAVLLSLNNYDKKSTKNKITSSLYENGLFTTVHSELLCEFDESMIREVMIELGFLRNSLGKVEEAKLKNQYMINKRNTNFLTINGNTEDNIRFLDLLGNNIINSNCILNAIEKSVPELRHYMYRLNSHETQTIESNTILRLVSEMTEDNIIPFLVHDCVYVPTAKESKYNDLFLENLATETIDYKVDRTSYLYDVNNDGSTKSLNTFLDTFENLYSFNNKDYDTKDSFKDDQKKYSYITTTVLGNNTKGKKNVIAQTIWSNDELNLLESGENLSTTSVKALKKKVKDYIQKDSNFRTYKVLSSLYLYSFYTGEYLFSLNELNIKELVINDFLTLIKLSDTKVNNSNNITNKNSTKSSNNLSNITNNQIVYNVLLSEKIKLNSLVSKIKTIIKRVLVRSNNLKKQTQSLSTVYLHDRPRIRGKSGEGG